MSRPISDAQIYMLLWAASCTYGAFSELHDVPLQVRSASGRVIWLLRTACDRPGLLGLGRRGLLHEDKGLWKITEAGRAELQRERTMARITAMADAIAADSAAQVEANHIEQDEYIAARAEADSVATADPDAPVHDLDTQTAADPPAVLHERIRTGPRPRAGALSSETLRFRCSEAEASEIHEACAREARVLSDVVRELLLTWARQGNRGFAALRAP